MVTQNGSTSWLGRNWKWLVPVSLLAAVLSMAALGAGVFFIVTGAMKSSGAYGGAVDAARANAEVVEALGEPIETGWWMTGSINVSGPSGEAEIAIPISGPRGKGKLYVIAEKSAGQWSFDLLEVEVAGREQRIDLLQDDRL